MLYKSRDPVSRRDLQKKIQQQGYSNTEFKDEVSDLLQRGLIDSKGKSRLVLSRSAPLYIGTLEMKAGGFGFAIDITAVGSTGKKLEDPYISRSSLHSAQHGDKILVLVNVERRRRNPEGQVVGTIEQGSKRLIGFFHREGRNLVVYPEDRRFPFRVLLDTLPKEAENISNGDAVVIDLDREKFTQTRVSGRLVEVLGSPDLVQVQVRMVAEKFDLATAFDPAVLEEAEQCEAVPGYSGREDLREVLLYTIDGEDAKDFDDAVGVEKLRHGYRLHVAIADVAAYVQPGSKLDLEAYARGTSIYFPDTVLPMLPENLSNNLCSLMPDEDRLAMTAVLDFDRQGVLVGKRFCRSIIRSSQRFTYTTVKQIIVDRDAEVRRRYKPFLTSLKWAQELGQSLQARRIKRGSVRLTIPEPEIKLGADGGIEAIDATRRNFAHQLIEEFMLAANEAVAQTFVERGAELLYRIHERPDPDKVKEFSSIARALGLVFKETEPTPKWYNSLVSQVEDSPREFILNSMLLRTLQQARYSTDNVGHFGLGAPCYTHFTSPIRRYPDLVVHRLLAALLFTDEKSEKGVDAAPSRTLHEAGLHLSARERNAVAAERDMDERLKCRFMEPRLGEHFRAIISALSDTLFFVELVDQFISGAVLLSSMTDDYYLHDWKRHRLIGDITGKVFRVGDVIDVELIEVDTISRKIYFTPSTRNLTSSA